jgi:predicted nucleic acid-binding protein
MQGNARPGAHRADASHLSEAAETGCSYFITYDRRILGKRDELHRALPPTLTIVTLAELLEIFDDFEAGRRI